MRHASEHQSNQCGSLTDDKAFFSPAICADGDEAESCSNICCSFSLSVEIVLKADFKVKYTTENSQSYRNDTRAKCVQKSSWRDKHSMAKSENENISIADYRSALQDFNVKGVGEIQIHKINTHTHKIHNVMQLWAMIMIICS